LIGGFTFRRFPHLGASARKALVNSSRPRLTSFDLTLYGLVLFAWGTSWIGMRMQVGVVPPETSVFWRYVIAASAMMAVAALRKERHPYALPDHLRFGAMGVFMFSTNFMLFYHGALVIPSGLLAVVFSAASIINLGLGLALFGQKLTARLLAGAVLGFSGILLLFAPQIMGATFDHASLVGLLLCIAGTISFCTGNQISASSQRRGVAVIPATAWSMAYGAIWAGLVTLGFGNSFAIDWSVPYVGSLVFLALSASVLAFYAYLTLLGRIGAGRAGYATVMFPVIALAISTMFEGYVWTWPAIAGATLALAGNFLVLRSR
jgi:drug/metabolite transporter (DMT)-like permease